MTTNNSASTGREYGADKTGEPNIPANPATGDASLRRSEAAPTVSGDNPPPGGGVMYFIRMGWPAKLPVRPSVRCWYG